MVHFLFPAQLVIIGLLLHEAGLACRPQKASRDSEGYSHLALHGFDKVRLHAGRVSVMPVEKSGQKVKAGGLCLRSRPA